MTCKAVFLGSKTLGLRVLECLFSADRSVNWTIIHPDDTGDARSMLDAFNDFARTNNLDMLIAASGPAAREMLRDGKYDVAFVCGWYWLFAEHDLSLTRLGFYGIHNSPLPKYRGGSPLVWAMINGDADAGSTVFRFSPGMDDGDVALQVRVPIGQSDTIAAVLTKIESEIVSRLPSIWHQIVQGNRTIPARRLAGQLLRTTHTGGRSN